MNFDLKKFKSELPPFFSRLLDALSSHGFTAILVGGSVRDFYLSGDAGQDWDIELRHDTLAFNKDHWKDLGKMMAGYGKVTYLPYEIIRLEAGPYQLEFSPPRTECFQENSRHHSNFTADYDFKLPYAEAVLRRDFTINTLGIRFKPKLEFELLDPLEGLRHLREKTLHPAGPSFSLDPVRFLRGHRFAVRFGFHFSPELESTMNKMDVSGFTSAYLWSEMRKSKDPVTYLERLLKEKSQHPEMKLPLEASVLSKFPELREVLVKPDLHETWMIALEWVGVSSEGWSEYFSQRGETQRRLARWARFSQEFRKLLPESFHGEFEAIRDEANFEKLFDWYFTTRQLLQKNPELPLLKMIEDYLPEWIHLYRFEAVKDVKHIDPPYRAKYQVWNLCQRL